MWIKSKSGNAILNSNLCEAIVLSDIKDGSIYAKLTDDDTFILGQYESDAEAESEFEKLIEALNNNETFYSMV